MDELEKGKEKENSIESSQALKSANAWLGVIYELLQKQLNHLLFEVEDLKFLTTHQKSKIDHFEALGQQNGK